MTKLFLFLFLLFALFSLPGCSSEQAQITTEQSCTSCHNLQTDNNHQQSCISCHAGSSPAANKQAAHQDIVKAPSHPDQLVTHCGNCHKELTDTISGSIHFSLKNSTNLFRKSFGAETELAHFSETPESHITETELQLADDLLRRRCFRCHPYSSGDNYPMVSHGTGCAACHLVFKEGKLSSHVFQKPDDSRCLSCHYGNYVGFDYYGRFEHDLTGEYRTPYTTKNKYFRPYGVEYRQLTADIHQIRGMSCIDCHSGKELMTSSGTKPSCSGCHSRNELQNSLPPRVNQLDGKYILQASNGEKHAIPLLQHPAHKQLQDTATCQACHAQWTFNDIGKHFLRSDVDDFESWSNLSVQGNIEIETIIDHNSIFENTELAPEMTDKLTGQARPGLWHKGFTQRRWETILLDRDNDGRISPMRPLLDYSLSWIDEDETVRFDSIESSATNRGLRPYVPHTTGPAGLFYKERLNQFLATETKTADQNH